MTAITYIQDRVTGELVLKSDYVRPGPNAPAVHGDIEAFKSPVTGEVIDDRGQLRRHNKKHGVTDLRDYGPEYFERKTKEMHAERTGQTPGAKKERIENIIHAIEQQRS